MDSAEELREYAGEYARNGKIHNIVYTDYTGNAVTKVEIQAGAQSMLLHRTGYFEGDLYFENCTTSLIRIQAA